jgi:type II secretory pathway component PulF
MSAFAYRVLLPSGRTRSGVLRLVVERDLSAKLWLERNFDAVVLSLYRLPSWTSRLLGGSAAVSRQKLPPAELSGLLRDLGVMTRAGVPIIEALKSIAEESDSSQKRIAATARLLASDLDAGISIADTFDRYPDLFPESVRNLMRIGEESGTVDRMLLEAAQHIERITALGRDVRQAMIYPAFVFITIFGAALFWIYYVIPNLAELFTQMHLKLPAVTRGILAMSKWLELHAIISITFVVVLIIGFWLLLRLHVRTRRLVYRLAHRMPVARVIVTTSGMAFITEHLALLIAAGVDIVRSLGVLERSLSDEYYRERIHKVRDSIERGEVLGAAMRQAGGFPPMALRMIAVGEETGSLDTQLKHLAHEYRERLAHLIASLSEIIKPLIILAAGAFFILLVVALLLPIYELVRQMSVAPMH